MSAEGRLWGTFGGGVGQKWQTSTHYLLGCLQRALQVISLKWNLAKLSQNHTNQQMKLSTKAYRADNSSESEPQLSNRVTWVSLAVCYHFWQNLLALDAWRHKFRTLVSEWHPFHYVMRGFQSFTTWWETVPHNSYPPSITDLLRDLTPPMNTLKLNAVKQRDYSIWGFTYRSPDRGRV